MESPPTVQVAALPNIYPGYAYFSLRVMARGSRCPCTLRLEAYNAGSQRLRLVVGREAGARIEADWLRGLLDSGISHAYVAQEDLEALQEYLRAQARRLLETPTDDPEAAHRLVYEQALCGIKSALLDPRNGRRLAMAVETVRQTFDIIWADDHTRHGLLRVMASDGRVSNHCLNVCLLGVGLAKSLGWQRGQAQELAQALFFHDLGLAEALAPPPGPGENGQLAHDDRSPEHPIIAHRLLSQAQDMAPSILETILHHHENLDGSGYPQGLKASQLSGSARLARIVDYYEASTSGFHGHLPLTPFQALRVMRTDMAEMVDQSLLQAFVLFLGQGHAHSRGRESAS